MRTEKSMNRQIYDLRLINNNCNNYYRKSRETLFDKVYIKITLCH